MTHQLVFVSALGCRAIVILCKLMFIPSMQIILCCRASANFKIFQGMDLIHVNVGWPIFCVC